MVNDYNNNRSLDEMVMVDEERKRTDEARRKKAEAERKRKVREEAKRKKAEAEKARKERERQRKERDERRKARNERREQSEKHRNIAESTNFDTENSFSPKPNNGGIMEQRQAPKRNHMEEYDSAIKEQDKLLDTIHKFQWENASTHTKAEAQAAKQMRDNVLAYRKKLEHDKVNANPADAFAYAKGTGGVSDYDKGMQHAMGNIGDGLKAEQARDAAGYDKGMSNAYGNIGDGLKAEQARDAASYNKGMQHALGGSNKTESSNVASEDTGSRNEYYDEMINRAADDYLNEWGGKDTAEAKEAWAAYGTKVDGLVEQRDAYNRAAMGVDTSAVQGGGGSKTVSLSAEGTQPMYTGFDDEEGASVSDSYYEGMLHAYGNWSPEIGESAVDDNGNEAEENSNGENSNVGEEAEREGSWSIGDKEYPIFNNFETLDQMEVIDSYTITYEEFDTAGFLLGVPGYLSDSSGPLMFIETIANFAIGANDSLGRYSLRVDIINDDGEEKVLIAFETKDNPLNNYYQNARWTKVDDEGTQIYVSNMWTGCKRYYIDKGHTTDDTLGYMYIDNGTLMFMPNILPNDKFLMSEKPGLPLEDVTALASQPFEIGQYE